MTRDEIRTLIEKSVPEQVRTTSELNDLINRAQRRVVEDTWCMRETITQTLTADVGEYVLDHVLLHIITANFYDDSATSYTKLDIRSTEWLDDNMAGWRTADSSSPLYIYFNANTVGLYPKPDTSGDKLYLEFVPEPQDLDDTYNTPFTLSNTATKQSERAYEMIAWLVIEQLKREIGKYSQADLWQKKYYNEGVSVVRGETYIKQDAKRQNYSNVFSYYAKFKL